VCTFFSARHLLFSFALIVVFLAAALGAAAFAERFNLSFFGWRFLFTLAAFFAALIAADSAGTALLAFFLAAFVMA